MYNVIETRAGNVLILNELVEEVSPLLTKCSESINRQYSEEDLLCWVVDMFHEDFSDEFGSYPQELLEKLALCILNAKHYLIQDKEQFVNDFNDEHINLEIGFDRAFYPVGTGTWYHHSEFVLMYKEVA
jgi:hypothetical protein